MSDKSKKQYVRPQTYEQRGMYALGPAPRVPTGFVVPTGAGKPQTGTIPAAPAPRTPPAAPPPGKK